MQELMFNMRNICTHTSLSLLMLMLVNVYNDGESGGGGVLTISGMGKWCSLGGVW